MKPDSRKKAERSSKEATQLSTFSTPKIRIKYFTCNEGKDHEGEVLNYVCVKKDCPKRGLLCSMCKINHQNHITIPLKILLSKLQTHKQKPLQSSQGFQNQLQQLQQIHKTMLYNLRLCVQSLAQKFRQIQTQINDQFSKAKIQLLERIQVNMKFNTFIEEAINNKFQNRQSFMEDIARISGLIDVKEVQGVKDKELSLTFSAKFDQVVSNLKNMETVLSGSLKDIEEFVNAVKIVKYEEIKMEKDKKKNNQVKKQDKFEQINKTIKLFSPDYKSTSIVLQQGNKIAKQTKTGQGRFVFTNFHIKSVKQKLSFKVKALKNWIGLGIGIRQKLKFLNFKFQYNNLGHGSYLISSNGYSWSHTEQANNIAVVGFKFKEGDIIQIQYDKTKLVYLNKASNQKHQLKLAFNQAEEKDIYFCANLCSDGDSVQIMEF